MADTAVVILNFNGLKFLKEFLPTVLKFSTGAQVYVVDNASTDGSDDLVSSEFPEAHLIKLNENHGYANGYNIALRQIQADYFVLLNSDIEVTEDWLNPIIQFMEENVNVAACQPKILDFNNRDKFEYAGAAGGFLDTLAYPFCRGRIFDNLESDTGQYDNIHQVFWASGACLFIRSEVFYELDGFDSDFFAHMEEIDLCWRINMMGKQVYFVPNSVIYHVGAGTLQKANPMKTYLNFRNGISMLYKNSSGIQLAWKLPTRFVFDIMAAIKFWFDNSFSHFWAVLRAYYSFLGNLSSLGKKRYKLKRMKSRTMSIDLVKIVVPVSFYLQGKKKFTQLKL